MPSPEFVIQEFRQKLPPNSTLAEAIDAKQPYAVIAEIARAEGYPFFAEALEETMHGVSPGIDKKPGPMY